MAGQSPDRVRMSSQIARRSAADKTLWLMMRTDAVDRDLLEEEARRLLGRVNKRDLVIFTNSAPGS